ncbi:PLDc N-terminal domain-containing protein [Fervidibacillus halotolerans]|uniref:PLDc N-terminal domain-containing protein n=1 Tax=Fervidibacillus halotolerans TaxID=2980027 RepID=A0A9E8LZV4_9BACI|nr:PLDc N-terminal domain-containing protein [Fervidibacillus halotolerans]WAA12878.1 PLDc N-terminal domain-containing protein [Fervidibacillus halotolerans]
MEELIEYLPLIIPILMIELILAAVALIHLVRHDQYRFGNRLMWILIILLVQIIGPILYFSIGKGDD